MAEHGWRDLIVGDRMHVDREFADRIRGSRFSSQQWSLVMTAVEFEIEGEGESARLVADTSKIGAVVPEIERIERQGPMAPAEASGGLVDTVRSALGLGGGTDPATRSRAVELADEYAAALQAHLEETGKWDRVVARAADQPSPE